MKFSGSKKNNSNFGVFSGEALLTPVKFNPNKEEIGKLYNKEEVTERNYFNIEKSDGKTCTRLELWLELDPTKQLKDSLDNYKTSYVQYSILIGKFETMSKEGKYQIIDNKLHSTWLFLDKSKSIAEQIVAAREEKRQKLASENKEPWPKDGLFLINENEARISCYGELAVLNLIYTLSSLNEREEDFTISLGEKPTQTFHQIVDGNFDILNNIFTDKEYKKLFTTNNKPNQVVGLLGASKNNDKIYQKLFVEGEMLGNVSLNRSYVKPKSVKVDNVNGETRLKDHTWKSVRSESYPWDCFFKDSTKFQLIELNDFPEDKTENDSNDSQFNDPMGLPDFPSLPSDSTDFLPF